ncbi:MAG: ABC transporter permease [Angelakisella sp.]|jgi:ABC-type uncharacterized transport system permease subunit|nr:ABC transporter permease [Angelakisella sp.]MCI9528660.1 ABC transporter permease [Angelakisella sp.]
MSNRQLNLLFKVIKTMMSVFIALTMAFVVILLVSEQPWAAIKGFIGGPFTSLRRFGLVLENALPLLFTGLGCCLIFSMGCGQIITEGAFYFAAVISTMVAISGLPLPGPVLFAAACLAAALAAAVVCLVPMVFYIRWEANLFVVGMMLNYILLNLGTYLLNYHLIDPSFGYPASYLFPPEMKPTVLIRGTYVTTAVFLGLALVVLLYLFFYRTRWGYNIRLVGSNPNFARYSGVSLTATYLIGQLLCGAVIGVGSACELFSRYDRFNWYALPGYGWDGILIATLASFRPQFVPLAALFLSYIRTGADLMSRQSDVAAELAPVVQSFMVLFIAANAFLKGTQQKLRVKQSRQRKRAGKGEEG